MIRAISPLTLSGGSHVDPFDLDSVVPPYPSAGDLSITISPPLSKSLLPLVELIDISEGFKL